MLKTRFVFLISIAALFWTLGQLACSVGVVDLTYEIDQDAGAFDTGDSTDDYSEDSRIDTTGTGSSTVQDTVTEGDSNTSLDPDTSTTSTSGSGSSSDVEEEPDSQSDIETTPPDDSATDSPFTGGLTITQIAAYQSTKITLMKNGNPVAANSRTAQLIAGKEALIRVFIKPTAGYSVRPIQAVIEFANGGKVYSKAQTINTASQDASINSTFNIFVPGDSLKMNEQFAVSLREAADSSKGSGSGARWPSNGFTDLGTFDVSGNLSPRGQFKIFLVPIKYDADGSGRIPAITKQFKQRLHDVMLGTYPATEIEITITEPVSTKTTITASGGGWSSVLNRVISFRSSKGAKRNEFYYGLVNPAPTMVGFCSYGCVAGMSPVGNLNCSSSWGGGKGSIGLGFVAGGADYTMAHEIAHALGRTHSPCGGPSDIDPLYPVANGNLDGWGWDIVDKELKDPSKFKDLMTYCSPQWISAHHYQGMAATLAKCNSGSMNVIPPAGGPIEYTSISIGLIGEYHKGPSFELIVPPEGEEERSVELLSADLEIVEQITGYFISYADTHWGNYVPDRPMAESPGYVYFPKPSSKQIVFARLRGGPAIALND